MRLLKKTYNRYFGQLDQVLKTKEIVIYRVTNQHGTQWYEVFKYQIHKPDKFNDDFYEAYPSDTSFGLWAWSCSNKKVVEKVLKEHFPDLDPDIYLQYIG